MTVLSHLMIFALKILILLEIKEGAEFSQYIKSDLCFKSAYQNLKHSKSIQDCVAVCENVKNSPCFGIKISGSKNIGCSIMRKYVDADVRKSAGDKCSLYLKQNVKTCSNYNKHCEQFAKQGRCFHRRSFISEYLCPKACNNSFFCSGSDDLIRCGRFKALNSCLSDPTIHKKCRFTCEEVLKYDSCQLEWMRGNLPLWPEQIPHLGNIKLGCGKHFRYFFLKHLNSDTKQITSKYISTIKKMDNGSSFEYFGCNNGAWFPPSTYVKMNKSQCVLVKIY